MLRPTPSEIVAGIARILRDEVAPAIDADHEHVREQLAQIVAVLGQVDWDDAGFAMVRADRADRRLLDDVQAWAAADPEARALVAEAAHVDGDADEAHRDDATSFAVARERAEASRRALAAVVMALTGPGDAPASTADLLERIAEHFTQEEPPSGGTTHSG